ncbi:MAG: cupin domain-containing protein [Crocinitomicaceae bacterium]|nr:cupin domain-containing protein [Crocinitomicaceae bacterium]
MIRNTFLTLFLLLLLFPLCSQEVINLAKFSEADQKNGVTVKRLFGDTLSTSFFITVSDTVPTHKHDFHSEVVHVLSGEAIVYLNNKSQKVRAGDVIFIPKSTWHAVKVKEDKQLEVLSIQSPGFDGSDRIFKENKKK